MFLYKMYYSQHNQDKWLNENIFKNKRNGVFVDIGAHNGIEINNTYFFEKNLGWSGICIEPNPKVYQQLCVNRKANCLHCCVYDYNGIVKFRNLEGYTEMLSGIEETYNEQHNSRISNELSYYGGKCSLIDLYCYRLEKILSDNGITHVDYLSIDTEGSEMSILKGIDFDKVTIDYIDIEINYRDEDEKMFNTFMESKGYELLIVLLGDNIYRRI